MNEVLTTDKFPPCMMVKSVDPMTGELEVEVFGTLGDGYEAFHRDFAAPLKQDLAREMRTDPDRISIKLWTVVEGEEFVPGMG